MIEVTSEQCWNEKFEKEEEKHKLSFSGKVIMIGLILFGICTVINSVLIYKFFNLLTTL